MPLPTRSLIWKRCIAKYYPVFFKKKFSRKIILIYHSVGHGPWAISPEIFKQQLTFLEKNCYIVSLEKLLKKPAGKNIIEIAITFDDGYACLYDTVFPILKEKNVPATIYINTGWIGDSESTRLKSNADLGHYPEENFLIWDEIKILEKNGWEIGSHGVNHIDLTIQPANTIKQELMNSKLNIENKLQKLCIHFAYTWGKYDSFLKKSVKNTGYRYAVTGQHGVINLTESPFALSRVNVALEYTLDDFKNIILGRWDFLRYIHKLKKKLKIGTMV